MSDSITAADGDPGVFDPQLHPELYSSVRTRRSIAFAIDLLLITLLMIAAAIVIFVLGVVTLGLGWLLYSILWPAVAILYYAAAFGSSSSATPGMRAMGLEMRLWYGAKVYALLGLMHALLYWFSVTMLTPLVLLVTLFSSRKRLLHDIVLGTVVVDSQAVRRIG